jgi:hypothetical protein
MPGYLFSKQGFSCLFSRVIGCSSKIFDWLNAVYLVLLMLMISLTCRASSLSLQSCSFAIEQSFVVRKVRWSYWPDGFCFDVIWIQSRSSSHNVINYNNKKARSKGRVVFLISCSIPITLLLSYSKADGWHWWFMLECCRAGYYELSWTFT